MKKHLSLALMSSILLLSGCIVDPPDPEYDTEEQLSHSREWYRIVKSDTLPCILISESITRQKLKLGNDMVRTSFLYHSGPDSTTLSGCVCWPVQADTCSEIWLENNITSFKWNECPSQSIMPGMLLSSKRKAVYIGADYQGLGLSREMDRLYFNTPLSARQSIDCLKTALTILSDRGLSLTKDYNTYNYGYSLGGAVSLAVAREVENRPSLQDTVHLMKSFCGNGPYDQVRLFRKFLNNPDELLEYPVEFLSGIITILYSNRSLSDKFSRKDIFTDKFLSSGILELIESKEFNSDELNDMLYKAGCATIDSQFTPTVTDPESDLHKAIMSELEKFDLTAGWSPARPILFFHSLSDMTVPIECLESVKERMKDNPLIEYVIVDSSSHFQSGVLFYSDLIFGLFKYD